MAEGRAGGTIDSWGGGGEGKVGDWPEGRRGGGGREGRRIRLGGRGSGGGGGGGGDMRD